MQKTKQDKVGTSDMVEGEGVVFEVESSLRRHSRQRESHKVVGTAKRPESGMGRIRVIERR